MPDYDKLIENVRDFPTLPTIYTNLMKAMSNPNSTVNEVAEVIARDQATTAKIIRFANSPVFAIHKKIEKISDAIFYIGFNEVKNIVLALSVMNVFRQIKALTSFNIIELWKHSIAVGVITRIYGQQLGIRDIENFFISGILHDIGKLFFVKIFKNQYVEAIEEALESRISLNTVEKKMFDADHCFVGGLIAEKWKLPNSLYSSIRHHEKGTQNGKNNVLIACVHLANITAQIFEFGNSGDNLVDRPNFEIWKILDFKSGTISALYDSIIINYEQSAQILSLKE